MLLPSHHTFHSCAENLQAPTRVTEHAVTGMCACMYVASVQYIYVNCMSISVPVYTCVGVCPTPCFSMTPIEIHPLIHPAYFIME